MHSLYDKFGRRKYLVLSECTAFLTAARTEDAITETFCTVLAYTGCRLSEALALTADRVDVAAGMIVFETLKRREKGVFRAVPVPQDVMEHIAEVHTLSGQSAERLWPWCRTTGYKRVKAVMQKAGIEGPQACPKGVRHGFAGIGLQIGQPLNLISRWLGHSDLETTAIYADVVGEEERHIARRYWETIREPR